MMDASDIETARDLRNWIRNTLPRLLRDDDRVSSGRLAEATYQSIVWATISRELGDRVRVDSERTVGRQRIDIVVTPQDRRYGLIAIEIKGPVCGPEDLIDDIKKLHRLRPRAELAMGMLLHFRATDVGDQKLRAVAAKHARVYYRRVPIPRRRDPAR